MLPAGLKKVHDLWIEESGSSDTIKSLCDNFDAVIGNGIPLRGLTAVYGGSGTGKTQLW